MARLKEKRCWNTDRTAYQCQCANNSLGTATKRVFDLVWQSHWDGIVTRDSNILTAHAFMQTLHEFLSDRTVKE